MSAVTSATVAVEEVDRKCRTALHFACVYGQPEVVELLLKSHCDINPKDNTEATPLIKAAQCRQKECLALLLTYGADPDLRDSYGNTALHYAVYNGDCKVAVCLLKHHSNTEAPNKNKLTPLLLALKQNKERMAELLINMGADIHATDFFGRTTLMYAVRCGSQLVTNLLLQGGIDINQKDIFGWTAKCYALKSKSKIRNILTDYEEEELRNPQRSSAWVEKESPLKPPGKVQKHSSDAVEIAMVQPVTSDVCVEQVIYMSSNEDQEKDVSDEDTQPRTQTADLEKQENSRENPTASWELRFQNVESEVSQLKVLVQEASNKLSQKGTGGASQNLRGSNDEPGDASTQNLRGMNQWRTLFLNYRRCPGCPCIADFLRTLEHHTCFLPKTVWRLIQAHNVRMGAAQQWASGRSKERQNKVKEKHFHETGQNASAPSTHDTDPEAERAAPAAGRLHGRRGFSSRSVQTESPGELSTCQQLDGQLDQHLERSRTQTGSPLELHENTPPPNPRSLGPARQWASAAAAASRGPPDSWDVRSSDHSDFLGGTSTSRRCEALDSLGEMWRTQNESNMETRHSRSILSPCVPRPAPLSAVSAAESHHDSWDLGRRHTYTIPAAPPSLRWYHVESVESYLERVLYLRCAKKCEQDQSVLCVACCLLTSLCDTVGVILARQLTIQEDPDVLGYLLGGIAAFGSWASQIPSFFKICRGKSFSCIHLWTLLLSALAGLLYASAIVAHDQQPEYLLRATPWFLTSLGRAALDLAIIFLSCVMKSRMRQAFGFATEARESSDTQAFLTCAEKKEKQEAGTSDKNSDWVPLTSLSHCRSLRTMTAISRYMELTVEPVQQASCSATRLPGDGQTSAGDATLQEPPSYPPIQVIRARVSSSSSEEVSSINSDLEQKYWEALNSEQWDPEDVILEKNKDSLEFLRSQVHRGSLSQADLTCDG